MAITLDQVFGVCELVPELCLGNLPGVSATELFRAESALDRRLPNEFRRYYSRFNGGSLAGGHLEMQPLLAGGDGELSLVTSSALLRSWGWPIPDELVIFAGGEEPVGLWLPQAGTARTVIVEVAEDCDEAGLAIIAESLAGYFATSIVWYLLDDREANERADKALDLLGVPARLRRMDPYTEGFSDILRNWANPNLPDKEADPYDSPWSVEKISEYACL